MHLEALELKQKRIFNELNKFSEFHLVGGTALALQIGHRISVDFDLFSKKDIPYSLLGKIKRVFKDYKIKIIVNHSEQLSIIAGDVKLDFVKYKFPQILKLEEFKKVKIVKVPEIAAMKAYTLNYRGAYKDYIDLYFIFKGKYSTIKEIKKITEEKYKNEFNFKLFLEQLIYLGDIKESDIKFLKEKVDKKELEKFFKKEIKNFNK